ncbi:hypothetical protein [Streptomyces sp. NPDC048277]|uniref:hypothetical protein n=1 Tax=Streptomyces sp. NPDC048277 TaxID=3155027 RepID=UPI0033E6C3F4
MQLFLQRSQAGDVGLGDWDLGPAADAAGAVPSGLDTDVSAEDVQLFLQRSQAGDVGLGDWDLAPAADAASAVAQTAFGQGRDQMSWQDGLWSGYGQDGLPAGSGVQQATDLTGAGQWSSGVFPDPVTVTTDGFGSLSLTSGPYSGGGHGTAAEPLPVMQPTGTQQTQAQHAFFQAMPAGAAGQVPPAYDQAFLPYPANPATSHTPSAAFQPNQFSGWDPRGSLANPIATHAWNLSATDPSRTSGAGKRRTTPPAPTSSKHPKNHKRK